MAKLTCNKESISIVLGALILTAVLLLPRHISPCPKGRTYETAIPGGGCPLFVDENQDQICDLVQSVPSQSGLTAPTHSRSNLNFSYALEFFVFLTLFIIATIFSLVKLPRVFPRGSNPNLCRGWTLARLRYLTLIGGLILGIWAWRSICPLSTFQLLFLQKDRIVLAVFPFLTFLIPIIASLFVGRVFCFWICPMGAFQELIWKASKGFNPPGAGWTPIKKPCLKCLERFPRGLNPLKGSTLRCIVGVGIVLGVVYFKKTLFCKICPFGFVFGCLGSLGVLGSIVLALLILIFAFLYRPFCRFLCPYGLVLEILSKFSFKKCRSQSAIKS